LLFSNEAQLKLFHKLLNSLVPILFIFSLYSLQIFSKFTVSLLENLLNLVSLFVS